MGTHKELITAGKFDVKFKRVLLDYYGYGFKKEEDFTQSKKTIHDDWDRLNSVISDYLEWSSWDERKTIMFASADSQSMENNPFHKVYSFCKYKPFVYPAYFFHTIAALSDKIFLTNGVDSLDLDDDLRLHLEDMLESNSRLKTSDLICFFTEALASFEGADKNKTPNNRLDDFLFMGLLDCEQYVKKGDRRWQLASLTLQKILDKGIKVNEYFERHLFSALDFFSRYYIFGEVGTFLKERLDIDEISPFRFKHEYFMQSLNDFNIIDLLYAIENKNWCRIKYRHGTADLVTEILCYPLEIRVSNMQGRQFLMYYEPFHRSYTALRIEFIDSIELYEYEYINKILVEHKYHSSEVSIVSDIANAIEGIKYLWGVSTGRIQEGNAIFPTSPHEVHMRIMYDEEQEYYILNRLNRECRAGEVIDEKGNGLCTYITDVVDEDEMRPWIRSFYSRIVSCEGIDTGMEEFIVEDTRKILDSFENVEGPRLSNNGKKNSPDIWRIPTHVMDLLGNSKASTNHDLVFNEIFSVYYRIMADVFVQLCSENNENGYTDSELDDVIVKAFDKNYLNIGEDTEKILPNEIKMLFKEGGFLKDTERIVDGEYDLVKNTLGGFNKIPKKITVYAPKYKCTYNCDMYKEIIPLSKIEIRWLKTIIDNSRERLGQFMSEEEIKVIDEVLGEYCPNLSPLPMEKIVFYDRFHFENQNLKRESDVIKTLLDCIYNQHTVQIKYLTMKNCVKTGEFKPIVLEFSKRNNRFQGYFQDCKSNDIYIMNISRIETAIELLNEYDFNEAEQVLIEYRKNNTTSVEIEFYNERNVADRILTEFAPWKKQCSYDSETQLFKLTIFYQKQDELDIVVRLMGYGSQLRYVDKEHPVLKEISLRMHKQMELIRKFEKTNSKDDLGDER